jgi:chromosomal replication initiation ATPase DnaA
MNIDQGKRSDALALAASARLAEVAASAIAHLPAASLRHAQRGRRPVARARQTAMYLTHVAFGLSLTRVGICFGRDRTTVRHACALTEDRRDDPALELGLSALEAGLVALNVSLAREARS